MQNCLLQKIRPRNLKMYISMGPDEMYPWVVMKLAEEAVIFEKL